MTEISFHYQKYWTRYLIMTPLLVALIAFHTALDPYIKSDILFYLIGVPIVLIGIGCALYLFDRHNVLVYEGRLRFDQGVYHLDLKRKSKSFRTVDEMFGWTAGWYGFSRCFCVQMKTDVGKIKLISAPLKKGQEFQDSDMVKLIEFIVKNTPDLENKNDEEESIWEYWYAKPNANDEKR